MGRSYSFARYLRIAVTAAILVFLALSPPWILRGLNREAYVGFLSKPAPEWHGRIEIWHVAEFRVYQGSVTDYLQKRADAYCRRHAGVHIDVVGLTLKRYNDRLARGAFPDAYSFPSGLVYREQLCAIEPALPALRGALSTASADGKTYAVPYLMSGYLLAANTTLLTAHGLALPESSDEAAVKTLLQAALDLEAKAPQLYMPPVLAARMGLAGTLATQEQFTGGQTALAVLDVRALGDVLRSEKLNLAVEAMPLTNYSEQVLYLGAAKNVDAQKAAVIADFIEFLLAEDEQQRLTSLGALPVTQLETPPVYTEELLDGLYLAYSSPAVPDPFSYQRHKEKLAEEALSALTGEPSAVTSFFERMQVVENGNI